MAQTQRKAETTEERLKTAQQYLVRDLQKAGYSVIDSQEMVRLARSMVGIGSQKPQSPTLDPIAHKNINVTDLKKVRDILIGVAKNPQLDVKRYVMEEAMIGLYGPSRTVALQVKEQPKPVKTYVYEVTVGDRTFKIETNKSLPGSGGVTSNLESTRVGQLKQMLVSDDKALLAITDASGRSVKKENFSDTYMKAYSNMLASENYDAISISRPISKRT